MSVFGQSPLLRNTDFGSRSLPRRSLYRQRAAAADLHPLPDIGDAEMRLAVIGNTGIAHTVIGDGDAKTVGQFLRADGYGAGIAAPLADAVLDGVFNERLHGQTRQHEILRSNIIFHFQIGKAHLLDTQVGFQIFKLLHEGYHGLIGEVCGVGAEIAGKVVQHPLGLRRVVVTEIFDGAERVVDKMGVCLQNHGVEPCLRQIHFFEK